MSLRRTLTKVLTIVFFAACAVALPRPASADCTTALRSAGRTYPVDTISYDLRDFARKRDLPLRIMVPKGAGPFPVIVFSPGLGAGPFDYMRLNRYWAEHGYVTISIGYSDWVKGVQLARQGVNRLTYNAVLDRLIRSPGFWRERVDDLRSVIGALSFIEQTKPAHLGGIFDLNEVGIAGHSMGAATVSVVAGASLSAPGWGDAVRPVPNVRAALLLSASGPGDIGFTARSYTHVAMPLMVMSGALDDGPTGQPAQWRLSAFTQDRRDDAYSVLVDDAGHLTWTGAGLDNATRKTAFFDAAAVTVAFWDRYLERQKAAPSFLTPAAVRSCSAGMLHLRRHASAPGGAGLHAR
ncbi:MAG: alpha/beta hydrolase family protein [Vulcanimicrobiaceae bacterium]